MKKIKLIKNIKKLKEIKRNYKISNEDIQFLTNYNISGSDIVTIEKDRNSKRVNINKNTYIKLINYLAYCFEKNKQLREFLDNYNYSRVDYKCLANKALLNLTDTDLIALSDYNMSLTPINYSCRNPRSNDYKDVNSIINNKLNALIASSAMQYANLKSKILLKKFYKRLYINADFNVNDNMTLNEYYQHIEFIKNYDKSIENIAKNANIDLKDFDINIIYSDKFYEIFEEVDEIEEDEIFEEINESIEESEKIEEINESIEKSNNEIKDIEKTDDLEIHDFIKNKINKILDKLNSIELLKIKDLIEKEINKEIE